MIKITTDSTCDLPRELLERYNITVTPLGIIKAGKLYQDGVDIRTGDIAAHVDAGGEITTTNAVNAADYETLFRDLTDENRTKVMGDLDEMEAVFKEIAALEAPKKYEEVQNCLSQSADSALKGIAVYRTELGAVTAETVDDAFLERVAEGDGYLQDAQDKMMEAAKLVGSLDS